MNPKLIVIEGPDGCGKETQSNLLKDRLEKEGYKVKLLSFPRYDVNESLFEENYLNGDYGKEVKEISPYETSVLFAVDRYDYFKKDKEKYDVIICDRFTTSNMIHQGSKIENNSERKEYINWLKDFEYNKLKIPKPDEVIFLELSPAISRALIDQRNNIKDIHEADQNYLVNTFNIAKDIAKQEDWKIVDCEINNTIRSKENISDQVYNIAKKVLEDQYV